MARLWSSGFELNSTTADVEFSSLINPSIVTTVVRSGTYANRKIPGNNTGGVMHYFAASNQTAPFYFRMYYRCAVRPTVQVDIMRIWNVTNGSKIDIRANTNGTLQLYNVEDSANIGSASGVLSTNTWYRIELKVDTTTIATTAVEALLDGVSFASGTVDLATGIARVGFGQIGTVNSNHDFYTDDLAVNNSSGSFQNSWPGIGEIIHLRPNANGDINAFDRQAGAGDHYTEVDEVTPDDITSYVATDVEDDMEEYNLDATPVALASDDVINCVQV